MRIIRQSDKRINAAKKLGHNNIVSPSNFKILIQLDKTPLKHDKMPNKNWIRLTHQGAII